MKKFVELDESGAVIYQEWRRETQETIPPEKMGDKPAVKIIPPAPSREGLIEAPDHILPGYRLEGEKWVAPEIVDSRTYADKRREEYPPIGDQLDALMKWLATEAEFSIPDELKSVAMSCMSVKAKYPKPE